MDLPDLWGKPDLTRVTHKRYRTVYGYVPIMAMDITCLFGGPHEKGNMAKLRSQALRGAADAGCGVEKIVVPFPGYNPRMVIM
jgi:hypothetical protein